ncbi:hypothetical protein B0H17DRAFT_1175483, partial [Mycena rosella]
MGWDGSGGNEGDNAEQEDRLKKAESHQSLDPMFTLTINNSSCVPQQAIHEWTLHRTQRRRTVQGANTSLLRPRYTTTKHIPSPHGLRYRHMCASGAHSRRLQHMTTLQINGLAPGYQKAAGASSGKEELILVACSFSAEGAQFRRQQAHIESQRDHGNENPDPSSGGLHPSIMGLQELRTSCRGSLGSDRGLFIRNLTASSSAGVMRRQISPIIQEEWAIDLDGTRTPESDAV